MLEKNILETSKPKWKIFEIPDSFLDYYSKETLASYMSNVHEIVDVNSDTSSLKRKHSRLFYPNY